jgi:hypothetical protein
MLSPMVWYEWFWLAASMAAVAFALWAACSGIDNGDVEDQT